MTQALPKITALAPWFGSNRLLASHVGHELRDCSWIGVPFAGGMCELAHIDARTIVVNDLHRHVINLARVAADPVMGPQLYRRLRRQAFHVGSLAEAQRRCQEEEERWDAVGELFGRAKNPLWTPSLEWAEAYFVSAWMSRHATAGTDREFQSGLSFRWDAAGGDSAAHFHNAVLSLPQWRRILRRCNFLCMDAFEFLKSVKDQDGHGLFCDPPFPDAGDKYKHRFSEADHRRLASVLASFQKTRLVVRFHDHPLIRELYPDSRWTWVCRSGRKQSNATADEVLLINGPSLAERGAA